MKQQQGAGCMMSWWQFGQSSKMEFETIGDYGIISNESNSFLLLASASGVATAFNNNLYDNITIHWTLTEEDYLKSSPAV